MLNWIPKKMLLKKAVAGAFFIVFFILLVNFFLIKTKSKLFDIVLPGVFSTNGVETNKQLITAPVVGPDQRLLLQFTEDRLLSIRYWDLANSSSRGTSSKRAVLPNLWRPQRGNLSRDDDRILAQLVWAMEFGETQKTTLSMNISNNSISKVKTISLESSFAWWNRYNWHGSYTVDENECPGMPGLWGRCVLSEHSHSNPDVIVQSGIYGGRSSSNNLLKFAYMLESAFVRGSSFTLKDELMATYYRGSDINTPYGKWVYYDPAVRFKDLEKDYSDGKTKIAAIFTSNCVPANNRLGYVHELQKYVEVDVFGACGPKRCSRSQERECFVMLSRDYATEKLFLNGFENDIIPIVMGAHPQDYQAMSPENSYIHIEDFANPKELANYMNYLAENPKAYNSYFRWKGTGTFLNTRFFCRVCAMAHYADVVPPPEWKQGLSWDSGNAAMCLPPGQWYWINMDHRFSTTEKSNISISRS